MKSPRRYVEIVYVNGRRPAPVVLPGDERSDLKVTLGELAGIDSLRPEDASSERPRRIVRPRTDA